MNADESSASVAKVGEKRTRIGRDRERRLAPRKRKPASRRVFSISPGIAPKEFGLEPNLTVAAPAMTAPAMTAAVTATAMASEAPAAASAKAATTAPSSKAAAATKAPTTASATTPAIPAVPAAPAESTPISVTAPIPARPMPTVIVKAVISATEKKLRLFDRGEPDRPETIASNAVHDSGVRRIRHRQRKACCKSQGTNEFV